MVFKRLWFLLILVLICWSCQDKRGLVVGKIQKASKLATTEFTIDKIVHGTKTKKLAWFIRLNEARFIAYSQAKVKAGVDLQKLSKDDIVIEGNSISLTLPAIEVLNFSYPPESFTKSRITKNAWANKISVMDQEEFFRRAEMDIRNNLEHMGIVETTQKKTRVMLTGLLKSLDYQEVYIEFESDELIIDKVPFEEEDDD